MRNDKSWIEINFAFLLIITGFVFIILVTALHFSKMSDLEHENHSLRESLEKCK